MRVRISSAFAHRGRRVGVRSPIVCSSSLSSPASSSVFDALEPFWASQIVAATRRASAGVGSARELEKHHALRNVSDHEPHLDGLAEGEILSLAAGGDRRLVELNGPRVVMLVDVHDHRLERLADAVLEDGRLDRRHDSALVLLRPSTRLLDRPNYRRIGLDGANVATATCWLRIRRQTRHLTR